VVLESSTQAEQLVIGTWSVCVGEPFGAGVVGAEFASDGTFRAFVRAADGRVVDDERSVGATWKIWPFDEPFDIHNAMQLDVVYLDGSTRIFLPELLSSPPFMAITFDAGLVPGRPLDLPTPSTTVAPPPSGTIPETGAGDGATLAIGVGFVLAGAMLVVAARRRDDDGELRR